MKISNPFGQRASEKPLRQSPPPSVRDALLGGEDANPAYRAGAVALGNAIKRRVDQEWVAREARLKAEADAKQAHEEAIWSDYLARAGR